MKNVIVTVVISTLIAISVPRSLHEAAAFLVRTGFSIVQLGLAITPPGYDSGFDEPIHEPPGAEDA